MNFEDTIRHNLLAIANAYHKATGCSMSEVSRKFYGSSTFFTNLRKRRQVPSVRTVQWMLDEFAKEWPKDCPKPVVQPIFMIRAR